MLILRYALRIRLLDPYQRDSLGSEAEAMRIVIALAGLLVGKHPKQVKQAAKEQLRKIIEDALKDSPADRSIGEQRMAEALRRGHFWISLPGEEFTAMIATPEQIVQL